MVVLALLTARNDICRPLRLSLFSDLVQIHHVHRDMKGIQPGEEQIERGLSAGIGIERLERFDACAVGCAAYRVASPGMEARRSTAAVTGVVMTLGDGRGLFSATCRAISGSLMIRYVSGLLYEFGAAFWRAISVCWGVNRIGAVAASGSGAAYWRVCWAGLLGFPESG